MLKLPSQMLGLPFPGRAGGECFRSEVEVSPPLWRRGGRVGSGLVGSSNGVGTPGRRHQEDKKEFNKYTVFVINCNIFVISSICILIGYFYYYFTLTVYFII